MLQFLIFAKVAEQVATGKGMSAEWGIVLAGIIIGLALTLTPSKRTSEIKKQKVD